MKNERDNGNRGVAASLLLRSIVAHPVRSILTAGSIVGLILAVGTFVASRSTGKLVNDEFGASWLLAESTAEDELASLPNFYSTPGEPWCMAIFAEPRLDSGSLTKEGEFEELHRFYKRIVSLRLKLQNESNTEIKYLDLCGSQCAVNDQLFVAMDTMSALSYFADVKMRWPVTVLDGKFANIGKFFFNRMEENGILASAKMTPLYFITFVNSTDSNRRLEFFEHLVESEIKNHNANATMVLNFSQLGTFLLKGDVERGVSKVALLLPIGCLLVLLALGVHLRLVDKFLRGQTGFLLLVAEFFVPPICVATSICTIALTQTQLSGPLLISTLPLLGHGWSICARFVADALEDFDDGSSVKSNAVLKHTFSTALGLATCFIVVSVQAWQTAVLFLSLFYAFLLILNMTVLYPLASTYDEDSSERLHRECVPIQKVDEDKVSRPSTEKLPSYVGNIVLASVVLVYVALAIIGLPRVRVDMDIKSMLPDDAIQTRNSVRRMRDTIWGDFFSLAFIVRNVPDFEDEREYVDFMRMLGQLEGLDNSLGRNASLTWLYDYAQFADLSLDKNVLPMNRLVDFLDHPMYGRWKEGMKFRQISNTSIHVDEMLFVAAYGNVSRLSDKGVLLEQARAIIRDYPQFDVHLFDVEAAIWDSLCAATDQLQKFVIVFTIAYILSTVISSKGDSFLFSIMLILCNLLSLGAAIALIATVVDFQMNPFSVAITICLIIGVSTIQPSHSLFHSAIISSPALLVAVPLAVAPIPLLQTIAITIIVKEVLHSVLLAVAHQQLRLRKQ